MHGHLIFTELWENDYYMKLTLKGNYKCLNDILTLQGDTVKETWDQERDDPYLSSSDTVSVTDSLYRNSGSSVLDITIAIYSSPYTNTHLVR